MSLDADFINVTPENLANEHLCCIIRSKKPHPGVEAKRQWLAERLREAHVFRKLDVKGCAFIEYAPLETAWVPVTGENYLYIYCLWVSGSLKGKGHGRALMEYCLADARARGKSGVCTLSGQRATRLPAAKINAGGVIVLGGRQPACVLFLASPDFFSLAGPSEFFGSRLGNWQGRRGSRAAARQRG